MKKNESSARTRARNENGKRNGFLQRLPLLIVAGTLALTGVWGAAAQAGSGGTGVGSGGGGKGDGSASDRYERMWNNFSKKEKRWAHRTSECESGQQTKIHGGGGSYHGAFQFMLSTWRNAPKSPGGDPHKRTWKTQAVVAVKLKNRDGAHHWPNCG
jgi:hypothetical protein